MKFREKQRDTDHSCIEKRGRRRGEKPRGTAAENRRRE